MYVRITEKPLEAHLLQRGRTMLCAGRLQIQMNKFPADFHDTF